jgi:hypothetical protein
MMPFIKRLEQNFYFWPATMKYDSHTHHISWLQAKNLFQTFYKGHYAEYFCPLKLSLKLSG